MILWLLSILNIAAPHSSVSNVQDLGTGGRWFNPRPIFSPKTDDSLSPLSIVFDNGYVGKLPVAWKEYCAE